MEPLKRKLPIGIDDFEKLRKMISTTLIRLD